MSLFNLNTGKNFLRHALWMHDYTPLPNVVLGKGTSADLSIIYSRIVCHTTHLLCSFHDCQYMARLLPIQHCCKVLSNSATGKMLGSPELGSIIEHLLGDPRELYSLVTKMRKDLIQ